MRNPWADEFERDYLAPYCQRGVHERCPHGVGLSGGLNPRRFRLEFGTGLCACPCHSPCPIADGHRAVPPSRWRESCSCPGAAAQRTRHIQTGAEPPDFGQIVAQKRRQSELRKQASQAVRAAAAGKSKDEIKDMLRAERQARGLSIPADHVLDANADAIMGNYGPALRLAGQSFTHVAGGIAELIRTLRSAMPPDE